MRLACLLLAPFAFTTGAFVFAGVLVPMAADLGVSVRAAAQLQAAFSVSCALAGPVLAGLTARFDRKRLLVASLVLLAVANFASAAMTGYWALFITRILAGVSGSLALPLASTMAVILAGPDRRTRALATVYGGVSLAFMTGIPMGSVIGEALSWHACFILSGGLALVAAVLIRIVVPGVPLPARPPRGAFRAAMAWPAPGYLGITLLAFAGVFTAAGYVGPIVTRLTGFGGTGIGAMQTLTGIGSLLGLVTGTRMVEKGVSRPLARLFLVMIAGQCIFSIALLGGLRDGAGLAACTVAMLLLPLALFGTPPIVQTRLAQVAGPAATVAFAMNGSMVYLGQGLGVMAGGVMLGLYDIDHTTLAGIALATGGLLLGLALGRPTRVPAPSPG